MRDFATGFYSSTAWKQCRENYKKSKRHLCERCLAKGIFKTGTIVHHKIYISPDNINDPAISLNPDNLELLCRDHHAEVHKGVEVRYDVDELGRIIVK